MKRLYAVRHGHYDDDTKELSEFGIEQVKQLAESLFQSWPEMKSEILPVILSSELPRALASANIIAEKFHTTVATVAGLAIGDSMGYAERTYNLVNHCIRREPEVETLILVSHEPHITKLPSLFAKEQFGLDWHEKAIQTATGWMIDCEFKTIKYLP